MFSLLKKTLWLVKGLSADLSKVDWHIIMSFIGFLTYRVLKNGIDDMEYQFEEKNVAILAVYMVY